METNSDTWVIIPVYNEGAMIGQVVSDVRKVFPNVVCIDDGSHDDSVAVARAAGAVVILHPINLGQGAALQTGIEYVKRYTGGKYIITFDADGQHSLSDAQAMLNRAKADSLGFVLGSRFLSGKAETGWMKKLILKTAARIFSHRTGLNLTDAHNGLRVLHKDAFQKLHLRQNRMAHANEIVTQLAGLKLPWVEMPVHIKYTEYSKAKGQSLWNSINILTELILN